MVNVGSVFQIAVPGAAESSTTLLPDTLLVVDAIEEEGLACRCESRFPDALHGLSPETILAVGMRPTCEATEFSFRLAGDVGAEPMIGCEVWASASVDRAGTFVGSIGPQGSIVVAPGVGATWLHLVCGPVVLESHPVVPGWQEQRTVSTAITRETLTVAALLKDCDHDLTELVTLRDAYAARCRYRREAGRTEEAESLGQELSKVLDEQVPRLREKFRRRRDQLEGTAAMSDARWQAEWTRVQEQLDALLRQPSIEEPPPADAGAKEEGN
jgi:hypothetical protein